MMAIVRAAVVVALAIGVVESQYIFTPEISTLTGPMRGHLVTVKNGVDDAYEFTGIPYAEPPIDDRSNKYRFRKTVPKKKWTNVLNAVKIPNKCPQLPDGKLVSIFSNKNVTDSEDCLYLNIWVPKRQLDAHTNGEKPAGLPVFFWIHGGAFLNGAASYTIYNGTTMSSHQNVIMVVIQYRLNAQGFAYLGTDDVPGNMGLWDQLEALKWVYNNIASFGGDPKRITIAGESAGAASTSHHLLSPHSRPYFHQAIIQSGSAFSNWGFMYADEALQRTNNMFPRLAQAARPPIFCQKLLNDSSASEAAKLKCFAEANAVREQCVNATESYGTYDNKLACLRGHTWETYNYVSLMTLNFDNETISPSVMDIPFVPTIDGDFIPRPPMDMIADGDFHKVPLLIGANKDEGSLMVGTNPLAVKLFNAEAYIPGQAGETDDGQIPYDRNYTNIGNPAFENITQEDFKALVKSYFIFYPTNGQRPDPILWDMIEQEYWVIPEHSRSQPAMKGGIITDQTLSMIGDFTVTCPTMAWAAVFANFSSVYHYVFSHRPVASPHAPWMGVNHGDELPFTMGDALNENEPLMEIYDKIEPVDRDVSARTLEYWTNFVKFGNPNTKDETLANRQPLQHWPEFTSIDGDTYEFDGARNPERIVNAFKYRYCRFWQEDLPKLHAKLKAASVQMPTSANPHVNTNPTVKPPIDNPNTSAVAGTSIAVMLTMMLVHLFY